MKLRIFAAFAAVLALALAAPTLAQAQTPLWSGIIAPSRAIDWSHAGLPPTLPDGETTPNTYTPPLRTKICASIAPEGAPGAPVAQTDINAAIASCPPGEVVYLEAGSFYISNGIDFTAHSDVTLRGAGPDQTIIYLTDVAGCDGWWGGVCIIDSEPQTNYNSAPQNTANWTAGYAAGTTQITLSNAANITPGKTLLTLDQLDGPSYDNGGLWECEAGGICDAQGLSDATRAGRSEEQIVLATAVSGDTVTISPGLYLGNWNASLSPGAWWGNNNAIGDGIENLTLDLSAVTRSPSAGVVMSDSYGCWIDNVRILNTTRNHVWVINSAHDLIADSYFYGTQAAQTQSYGVEGAGGSDNLLQNNIFQHIVSGVVLAASSGTVVAYNYGLDDYYSAAPNVMMAEFEPHDSGMYFDLFEGNVVDSYNSDDVHGTQNLVTLFRNQFMGADLAAPARTTNTYAVQISSWHRFFNVIGNVLGDPGFTATYQSDESNTVPDAEGNRGIYLLEVSGQTGFAASDALSLESLMRWGNYDVVHGSTQWNDAEVPSTLEEDIGYQQALTGTGDGPYTATLANCSSTEPALADDVTIQANGEEQGYDNGSGVLESSLLNTDNNLANGEVNFDFSLGTVNYTGCTVSVLFLSPPSDPTVQYLTVNPKLIASPFQNPVPTSQTLPASFFLSSEPAWWQTQFSNNPPWPAIGPDVTGGPGPGGHAYPIPAELCYQNSPNDPNYPQDPSGLYVKLFNAAKCYGQPPAPPSDLAATVVQ